MFPINFSIEITPPGYEHDHTIKVFGRATPYVPAKTTGHPDTWSPPDGGDVEVVTMWAIYYFVGGSKMRELPIELREHIQEHPDFEGLVLDGVTSWACTERDFPRSRGRGGRWE